MASRPRQSRDVCKTPGGYRGAIAPKLGGLAIAIAGSKQEPRLVPPADAKPCLVARLVAAITGQLPRAELDADLAAAVDAVAIMEACYQSNRANAWVDVAKV